MAAPAPPFPWQALPRLYRVMGSIALPWALARMYPAAEAAPVARKRPRSGTFHRAEECGGRATFLVSVQLLFLKMQMFIIMK